GAVAHPTSTMMSPTTATKRRVSMFMASLFDWILSGPPSFCRPSKRRFCLAQRALAIRAAEERSNEGPQDACGGGRLRPHGCRVAAQNAIAEPPTLQMQCHSQAQAL